jgi:hypothetical protein
MLETLSTAKPFDRTVINLKEDDEVRYWTAALGVTRQLLQKLVNEHGASPRIVRAFLRITRDLPEVQAR